MFLPIHGAAGDEGGKLERSRAELFSDRREAENYVQILPAAQFVEREQIRRRWLDLVVELLHRHRQ